MIVYKILKNRYYGGSLILSDKKKGIPLYTTRTSPPEIPEGMYAIWTGIQWKITQDPPPPPVVEEEIILDSSQDSDLSLLGDSDSS